MTVCLLGSCLLRMHMGSDDGIDIGMVYIVHMYMRTLLPLMSLYNRKHDLVQYVLSAHIHVATWQLTAVPETAD